MHTLQRIIDTVLKLRQTIPLKFALGGDIFLFDFTLDCELDHKD